MQKHDKRREYDGLSQRPDSMYLVPPALIVTAQELIAFTLTLGALTNVIAVMAKVIWCNVTWPI